MSLFQLFFGYRPQEDPVQSQINKAELIERRFLKMAKVMAIITAVLFVLGIVNDIFFVSREQNRGEIIINDLLCVLAFLAMSGICWLISAFHKKKAAFIREKNTGN